MGYVRCTGTAKLSILETGEVFEVVPEDLSWERTPHDSRPMGPEYLHEASIEFNSDLGDHAVSVTWSVYEYPTGTLNAIGHDVSGGELVEDFDFEIAQVEEEDRP